jgi:hypothetical protein
MMQINVNKYLSIKLELQSHWRNIVEENKLFLFSILLSAGNAYRYKYNKICQLLFF